MSAVDNYSAAQWIVGRFHSKWYDTYEEYELALTSTRHASQAKSKLRGDAVEQAMAELNQQAVVRGTVSEQALQSVEEALRKEQTALEVEENAIRMRLEAVGAKLQQKAMLAHEAEKKVVERERLPTPPSPEGEERRGKLGIASPATRRMNSINSLEPVSYTHLTLPTILLV